MIKNKNIKYKIMSTLQENLDRIKTAKSAIKSAIIEKGVDVADEDKIDTYAEKILQIKSGGGTTEIPEFDPDGPLTFYRIDDIGDSYVSFTINNSSYNMQYSTDKETWNTYKSNQKIKLNKDEYVQFKGTIKTSLNAEVNHNIFNTQGGLYNLYGKMTSIDNYADLNKYYMYIGLFTGTNIYDASNLDIYVNNIKSYDSVYKELFKDCIQLVKGPNLKPDYISKSSNTFLSMYENCRNLKELPLFTMRDGCANSFKQTFKNCIMLTDASSFKNNYITNYCYQSMFQGCTSLTTAPDLPATTAANSCYKSMFQNCTSLISQVDRGKINFTSAYQYALNYMFKNCPKLNKVAVCLTSSSNISEFISGSSTGTFYYSKKANKGNLTSIIPSGWTAVQSSSW